MENIQNIVGVNIRYYRRLNNLTQEELAERVDVSSPYIGYLERGQKSPSLELLIRIASALNIEPALLLTSFDEEDTQLKQLILLLSDKAPQDISFIKEVALAYFKSLEKKWGNSSWSS